MATQRSRELKDPMLSAGWDPSVKLKSLEDKAGYCSLQSLGVQHRPGLTEDSGDGGDLSAPGQVWGPRGTCGGEGDPAQRGEAGSKALGPARTPLKGLTPISQCQGHMGSSELGQTERLGSFIVGFTVGHLSPVRQ